jgi:hypothetical protein
MIAMIRKDPYMKAFKFSDGQAQVSNDNSIIKIQQVITEILCMRQCMQQKTMKAREHDKYVYWI